MGNHRKIEMAKESKKDDITLEDLMGLPSAEQAGDNKDESEDKENSSNEEPKELQDVVNAKEKEQDLDAGLTDDDSTEEEPEETDPTKEGYEDQAKDKQLTENIDEMAQEDKKENETKSADSDADLKQKVVGIIKKFKGNAQAIEQMREASPEAYSSTLEVINIMLDLARALGLCGGDDSASIEEGLGSPEEDKLGKSMILPTKRTTRHIPKPRRPVGSVDSKGREKSINDEGDISWVDRKRGVIRDKKGQMTRRDDE